MIVITAPTGQIGRQVLANVVGSGRPIRVVACDPAGLSPGTVYVSEFSGTQCAPCIKMIPHLEELQRTYTEVVFLRVFTEPEDGLRRFLVGRGKGITLGVVDDPDLLGASEVDGRVPQLGLLVEVEETVARRVERR